MNVRSIDSGNDSEGKVERDGAISNEERGRQVKKLVCLLGILCSILLVYLLNMPVFASGAGESGNSQITIEEFVRSVHPHGVSVSSAIKYRESNSSKENVSKLLKMLKEEDEKAYWSNIVITLGLIADPLAIPQLIGFIKKLEKKGKCDYFESRALSNAVWALGLAINEGRNTAPPSPPPSPFPGPNHPFAPTPPTEDGSTFEEASNFLIKKSKGRKEVIYNRQYSVAPPFPNHKTVVEDEDIVRDASILGLAFADTKETREELKKIFDEETDKNNKLRLQQVIQAQDKIHNAGSLLCYREPKSQGCK